MPDVYDAFGKRSESAIAVLKAKVALPSRSWSDYQGMLHGRSFSVAGATKMEIVTAFQDGLVKALEEGTTLSDFRKNVFDKIVKEQGWSYKGSRGWRSKLIYNTNMRTAKMAGKWSQIERNKKTRPFLEYIVVDDNRLRDAHRKWANYIGHVDDPFWNTHYPPNGWGPCRCDVIQRSQRDLDRRGLTVSDKAPELNPTSRVNTVTGEDFGKVPKGIDVGWDHNVGKSWLGADIALGRKIMELPEQFQSKAISFNAPRFAIANLKSWQLWLKRIEAVKKPSGYAHSVGLLKPQIISELSKRNIQLSNALVVVEDRQINHLKGLTKGGKKRTKKGLDKRSVSESFLRSLPLKFSQYKVALLEKKTGNIMLVFEGATKDKNYAFIRLDFTRRKLVFNSVRSLGVRQEKSFKNTTVFELIDGAW